MKPTVFTPCHSPRRLRQQGFTMVEMVLALIVAGGMIFLLIGMQQTAGDDIRAKRNADSLQQFAQTAMAYLDANRDVLVQAMSASSYAAEQTLAGKHCVLNGDTANPAYNPRGSAGTGKATCALDVAWLKAKKLLPAGYPDVNPYGQGWVAIYRLVYADYDSSGSVAATEHQGDIEMLVVATGGQSIPNNQLGVTMNLLGGIGGLYPPVDGASNSTLATCPNRTVCGSAGWRAAFSDFIWAAP